MNFLEEAASRLGVANEALTGEKEVEYCYFLKVSEAVMTDLMERSKSMWIEVIEEQTFPFNPDVPKLRIRHYKKEGKANDGGLLDPKTKYELTTKVKLEESKAKLEYNQDINESMYQALGGLSVSKTCRMRIYAPILINNAPVMRANGNELAWEIDIYLDRQTQTWSQWIKLELEVDEAKANDIVNTIPIEYETLIHGDSQEPAERDIIQNLYDHAWNLKA